MNTSKSKKYAVHYTDEYGRTTYIHIFGTSPEDVTAFVKNEGVGFENGRTVRVKSINAVEFIDAVNVAPPVNEERQ